MGWIDKLTSRFLGRGGSGARTAAPAAQPWLTAPERATRGGAASSFPRFQSTAGDQLDPRASDNFANLRVRLRGAYTPAQPVADRRMFAGRTKALTNLIRAIEDQRLHSVIYGERGLGKTSMLHVLAQTAREARYLVIYVTCGAGSNFDEMFRTIADGIPLLFHSQYGPTSNEAEAGATLLSLLPHEPVSVRTASDMLSRIAGTRVLVILDEFDRAESDEFRRAIAELLKSLSDRSARVQLVIAGVAANLTELVANVPSIQRNISALQIPKMTAAEIRGLVKNGEALSGLTFDDGAVHAIISRSIGFPYLASMLAHRAALIAIDQSRTAIGAEDVASATSEAVDEFKSRVSRRSQLQIEDRVQKGMLGPLGALAGAAQSTGGLFSAEDISALHADPANITAARGLADRMATEHVLIESRDDEFGRSYRFFEDSVPVYLWLLAAQGRFFEGRDAANRDEAP